MERLGSDLLEFLGFLFMVIFFIFRQKKKQRPQDEQEDDLIDHLPSYAKRYLTNGSFRRRSELESDEIQVDSSQYMIPAFLRRKAD